MSRSARVRKGEGRERFKALLAEKCVWDRIHPVMALTFGLIHPTPELRALGADLPEYCHRLAALFRRTWFGALKGFEQAVKYDPTTLARCATPAETVNAVEVDWEAYGAWQGILELALQRARGTLGDPLDSELAELPPEAVELIFGKHLASISEVDAVNAIERIQQLRDTAAPTASMWGTQALAQTHMGVAKGLTGLIDEGGNLARGTPRDNVYTFLAMVWPEIRDMQAAMPPQSRRDLFEWLQPFVTDGLVSLGNFDHFCDVCDEIGLKLKGRGRPRKRR